MTKMPISTGADYAGACLLLWLTLTSFIFTYKDTHHCSNLGTSVTGSMKVLFLFLLSSEDIGKALCLEFMY